MSEVLDWFADRRFNRIDMLGIYMFGWVLAGGWGWWALAIVVIGGIVSAIAEDRARKTLGE